MTNDQCSTAQATNEILLQAIADADFSKLTGKDKQLASGAVKIAACRALAAVILEVSTEYKQEKSNLNQGSKFAKVALERMKAASPNAQIDFLGIDIVRETADRVTDCEYLPIPISTAAALLNYGIDQESVYISKDGSSAAASALTLAEASDEDIYTIVADTWLHMRSLKLEKPLKAAA